MQITTIGLDIAKNVFQVHGIDAMEKVSVRKQLRRGQVIAFFKTLPPCLIGMEACATAHYWARELRKLGHEGRPPTLSRPPSVPPHRSGEVRRPFGRPQDIRIVQLSDQTRKVHRLYGAAPV